MIRLALCCKFNNQPIKFRTTTARNLKKIQERGEDPLQFLSILILDNLNSLQEAINYCAENHIGGFRVGSDLFPSYTHPDCGYQIDELPNSELIYNELGQILKLQQRKQVRLSFHPDQFVVINSPRPEVVENSIKELEYQGFVAELIGADVINIHGGGGYGDKLAAIKRFETAFKKLSRRVQSRLTVENDDVTYTPEELLPLCKALAIPLVYDVHHHRCLPDKLSIEKATDLALNTWKTEPLFHISSPKNGWNGPKPKYHSDLIDPNDMPKCWKSIPEFTLDIEAKGKEVAVQALYQHLKAEGWAV
ncbi:MAG: UV DNA damage endonuclease [Chlamydiia bacterium]|nr:UV DNA damage endonuclease [Chlamydiia bacterium]MCH9615616.1 UV DNA damage endonuclease [Chlamydiia bacterium]MCH9628981.1 UV DNA damage endonuclease [Chlamydiia bacterium]